MSSGRATVRRILTPVTAGASYIRVDDLRRLLHVLGRGLPHWLVREAAGVLATAVRVQGSQSLLGFCRYAMFPGQSTRVLTCSTSGCERHSPRVSARSTIARCACATRSAEGARPACRPLTPYTVAELCRSFFRRRGGHMQSRTACHSATSTKKRRRHHQVPNPQVRQ
jgi:hypothetical protein